MYLEENSKARDGAVVAMVCRGEGYWVRGCKLCSMPGVLCCDRAAVFDGGRVRPPGRYGVPQASHLQGKERQ